MTAPLIIGHRGASSHAPENTLAAIDLAISVGADGVEFDVQLAADGVPVVIHDRSLKRTGGRRELVSSLTSRQLAEIDVGSWFCRRFPEKAKPFFSEETVPTLERVLDVLKDRGGLIYVELKYDRAIQAGLAEAVCDVIKNSALLPQMIVKSFRLAAISEVRSLLPHVETAALFEPTLKGLLDRRETPVHKARSLGATQISLHRSLATPGLTAIALDEGMPVTVWTADDPRWVERARSRSIRAVITNDPAKMLSHRDAHAG